MSDVIIYSDGELELKVSVDGETTWLNRNQIAELFSRDIKTIGKHINNVFSDGELEKFSAIAKFATTATDGKIYNVEFYNLDVVISVGYRVKSQNGVKFRQWATSVLKSYIQNGYAINAEKITNDRFVALENIVHSHSLKLNKIEPLISSNTLDIKQGIFFDGQTFDAYVFITDLIKSAKKSIVLIDNYIDESTLALFSKNPNLQTIIIYTQDTPRQLQSDVQKYNRQYNNLSVRNIKNFHDRFMIVDDETVYHIGASLKDLGKKVFAFSKIDLDKNILLQGLQNAK